MSCCIGVYLLSVCNIRSIGANSPSIFIHLWPLIFARHKLESIRNSRSTAATSDRFSPENRWTNQQRSCCVLGTTLVNLKTSSHETSRPHSAAVCTHIHLLQPTNVSLHLKHNYHPCSDLPSMDMQATSRTPLKGRSQSILSLHSIKNHHPSEHSYTIIKRKVVSKIQTLN